MAWNKALPANSTKIRDYPTALTDNFTAIEEGENSLNQWKINLIQRNAIPSAPPANPATLANNIQLFAKQSIFSRTELFLIDDHATPNIIQLTQDGLIGAQNQSVRASSYFYGGDTIARGLWSSPTIVGRIDASGNVLTGSQGIASTSLQSSPTRRRVNFDASRITNTNYIVIATATSGSSNARMTSWLNKTTSYVDIQIMRPNGDNSLTAFDIVIFGGR